ncbi:hypothetical protein [Psychroserpens sp. SPM9]|uniref:hypothetical protein n=1 Tax=Psychroserpens sp. SPM9 TaxID=2975598 RepID=UPI0021A90687|nr:hypothetical protein [Psychroserpens sp. SPM9]MDG5491449.1 hypothetical protein [Psychroserpens sp. SPM9]
MFIILYSCKEKETPILKHPDLLGFKVTTLADSDEDLFDVIEKKEQQGFIETKYINDILYVSTFQILNACGNYEGNIETSNDTISLQLKLISEEVCTSESARRVTYLIYNPTSKKRIIIK